MLLPQFPPDERRQSNATQDKEGRDEMRAEPVIDLPAVEYDLQGPEADGQKTQAHVIELPLTKGKADEMRRVLDQTRVQDEGENPNGYVDEEDPAPGVIVCNPPSKKRSQRRRDHGGDGKHCRCLASFLRREGIHNDGLRDRLQAAATKSLKHAEK